MIFVHFPEFSSICYFLMPTETIHLQQKRTTNSMTFNKTKTTIAIAVLTGLLVGFVFGAAYVSPGSAGNAANNAKGNVSSIAKSRHGDHKNSKVSGTDCKAGADTLRYTVTDEDGESWNMIMTK